MTDEAPAIVAKLWNYCDVLQDDGVSYGDYVQQLTNLLKKYDWESLVSKKGDDLETHYRHSLEQLGKESGLLGVIYRKSQNKIQDPAKLERLIKLINEDNIFS